MTSNLKGAFNLLHVAHVRDSYHVAFTHLWVIIIAYFVQDSLNITNKTVPLT